MASVNTSDEQLIAAMRNDDEDAFVEVVRRHGPRMLTVARRFLPNEADAQDAVQEAFLSAFRGLSGFKEDAKLSTWLHRITVNAALMKLRSARRKPDRPLDDLLPSFQDNGHLQSSIENWAVSYDKAVDKHEIREVVRNSISALPDNHRTVLLLRDIEGRTTEQTAEILGIQPGAVKTRLHRARQALRTLLDPYMRGAEA